jgi:ABC-type microcin C transport system permease subunit YejE
MKINHFKILKTIFLAIFGGYIGAIFGAYSLGIPVQINCLIIILGGLAYLVVYLLELFSYIAKKRGLLKDK